MDAAELLQATPPRSEFKDFIMHGNGRPYISNKKLARLCVALTLLVWATQVLFKQWAIGAELPANQPVEVDQPSPRAEPGEHFLRARPGVVNAGVTLQLRAEASVTGAEVRLKQIARWSHRDADFFQPVADLVLVRLDARGPYRVVELDEVRKTLADAGVNMAMVRIAGAMTCSINRSDMRPDSEVALAKWIDAKEKTPVAGHGGPSAAPLAVPATVELAEKGAVRSLREVLMEDLSVRVGLPLEVLQLTFNPKDERLLSLSEPQFKFNIEAQRVRNLGDVNWVVTIIAGEGSQKSNIIANARAWQNQVVVNRPIPCRSLIRNEDVVERRTLIDRLPDEPVLSAGQGIGQQAARDLKPGTILTSRMVEAVQLCKTGQLVTVSLSQGAVRVKSVARCMESGSLGQRVRVKNEVTNEIYDVVLTGPQEALMGEPH